MNVDPHGMDIVYVWHYKCNVEQGRRIGYSLLPVDTDDAYPVSLANPCVVLPPKDANGQRPFGPEVMPEIGPTEELLCGLTDCRNALSELFGTPEEELVGKSSKSSVYVVWKEITISLVSAKYIFKKLRGHALLEFKRKEAVKERVSSGLHCLQQNNLITSQKLIFQTAEAYNDITGMFGTFATFGKNSKVRNVFAARNVLSRSDTYHKFTLVSLYRVNSSL